LALKASIEATGRQRPAGCSKICGGFRDARTAASAQLSTVEVLAQRRPGIILLREAAALQLGDNELDEFADVVHRSGAATEGEAAVGPGLEMHPLELVDDRLRRAGCDQDAIHQEAPAEFLERLLRVDGLEQLLEAAEIALLGANLVGEVGKPHARFRGREVDA